MQAPEEPVTKEAADEGGNAPRDIPLLHPAAEGRLEEIEVLLGQMLQLAEASAAEGTEPVDREGLQKEFDRLRDEIDRIADKLEEDSQP